jgi:hypothetical protein
MSPPCCRREFEAKLKAAERKVYALTKERDALRWGGGMAGSMWEAWCDAGVQRGVHEACQPRVAALGLHPACHAFTAWPPLAAYGSRQTHQPLRSHRVLG